MKPTPTPTHVICPDKVRRPYLTAGKRYKVLPPNSSLENDPAEFFSIIDDEGDQVTMAWQDEDDIVGDWIIPPAEDKPDGYVAYSADGMFRSTVLADKHSAAAAAEDYAESEGGVVSIYEVRKIGTVEITPNVKWHE